MKRRAFLKSAAAGAVTAAVASPAIAQTAGQVNWRMTTSWPKSLDTIYGSVELMCKRIGELTDGKFKVTPFAGGEIVQIDSGYPASFTVGKDKIFVTDISRILALDK